jgi:thiol:disulfide interchange protein DsbA
MKTIIILFLTLFSLTACFEDKKPPLPKGVLLIEELDEFKGEKIIVSEFFWYGCPHCNIFRNHIEPFAKNPPQDVDFNHIPVPLRPEWVEHAKMYYALEKLGFSYQVHHAIFDEMHKRKNKLDNEKSILDFVTQFGFNREDFARAMNSNAIADKILQDTETITWLGLRQTPVITINNKYKITLKSAGGYQNILPTLNKLLDYIRQQKD